MKAIHYCMILGLVLVALTEAKAKVYVYGVDVSNHQGTINWNRVKAAQKDFAFVKATEGVGYLDSYFHTNMIGANNAGLYVGAYHFATPYTGGVNDAIAEANEFSDAVMPYIQDGYLRPVLDLESRSDLGRTTLSNWTNAFMNQVKTRTGVDPIIYCNSNYAANYLNSSVTQWDLWIANWTMNPYGTPPSLGVWSDWVFWQYSAQMTVDGINTNSVDGNAFNGTMAELAAYAIPEPVTLALLSLGVAGLIRRKR
jgi:lysozyme